MRACEISNHSPTAISWPMRSRSVRTSRVSISFAGGGRSILPGRPGLRLRAYGDSAASRRLARFPASRDGKLPLSPSVNASLRRSCERRLAVEPATLGDHALEQRRRLPVVAEPRAVFLDARQHLVEAHGLGVEHRAAAL